MSEFDSESLLLVEEEYKSPHEDVYNNEKGFFDVDLDHEAPIPVCDCIAFMRKNKGFETEGLFRVPGSATRVREASEAYNQQFGTPQAKLQNAFSVLNETRMAGAADAASLLKNFIKHLKSPLIPSSSSDEMLDIMSSKLDEEDTMLSLANVVKEMKQPNRGCFCLVVSFLREVAQHSDKTKMNSENLATCLILTMMRGEATSILTNGAQALKVIIEKDIKLYLPDSRLIKRNTHYDPELDHQKLRGKPKTRSSSFFFGRRKSSLMTSDKTNSQIHDILTKSEKRRRSKTRRQRTVSKSKDKGSIVEEIPIIEKAKPAAKVGKLSKNKSKSKLSNASSRKLRKRIPSEGGARLKTRRKSKGRKRTSSHGEITVTINRVRPSKSVQDAIAKNMKSNTLKSNTSSPSALLKANRPPSTSSLVEQSTAVFNTTVEDDSYEKLVEGIKQNTTKAKKAPALPPNKPKSGEPNRDFAKSAETDVILMKIKKEHALIPDSRESIKSVDIMNDI